MTPDEVYGRVTNPERYATLHDAVDILVERLGHEYEIVVRQQDPDAFKRDHGVDATEVIEVVPAGEGAASLRIARTDFPGVAVRFGRWHLESFPVCGCDACDEQPEELVEGLEHLVAATTEGGFREELTSRWLSAEFIGAGFRESRRTRVSRSRRRELGDPARLDWGEWPRRSGGPPR